jgi:hypothetical protein
MKNAALRTSLSALILLVGTATLHAQDGKKVSPLASHLPLATEACFGRVYDAAHLSKHPKQRVTSFHLSREFKDDPYSEVEFLSEEDIKGADGEYGSVNVTAYVRFRDRKGVYTNGLSCHKGHDGIVRCGVDCDGGSFNLRSGGQSLLLENNGFVVVGGCGASEDEHENEEHVLPGADDKLFRLDPKPVTACMAERAAMAPVWAKLGTPLRTRFKDNETLCLSRTYDAAHLAAHPRQTVKRIAVLKTRDSLKEPGAQYYELTLRVETKSGKIFEGKTDCGPDSYAYGCQPKVPMDEDRYFYVTRAGGNDVLLRDKHALLEKLFNTKLGSDDRIFRLQTAPADACRF